MTNSFRIYSQSNTGKNYLIYIRLGCLNKITVSIDRAFSPLYRQFIIPSASSFAKTSPGRSRWAGIERAVGALLRLIRTRGCCYLAAIFYWLRRSKRKLPCLASHRTLIFLQLSISSIPFALVTTKNERLAWANASKASRSSNRFTT
jgi:hypothetical protein